MTPLQLGKIVQWASTLKSRKRLQKVVYLLQVNGAPIEAEYTLHHYGPYTSDVARLADQMVQTGLLEERQEPNMVGNQFCYTLSPAAQAELAAIDEKEQVAASRDITPFEAKSKKLLEEDLKDLEIAATVAYFRKQGKEWAEAERSAARFKTIPVNGSLMQHASRIARGLMA